ncbi:MAG: hypothetical protein AB7U07_13210 [Thermoleophilia bacterium]
MATVTDWTLATMAGKKKKPKVFVGPPEAQWRFLVVVVSVITLSGLVAVLVPRTLAWFERHDGFASFAGAAVALLAVFLSFLQARSAERRAEAAEGRERDQAQNQLRAEIGAILSPLPLQAATTPDGGYFLIRVWNIGRGPARNITADAKGQVSGVSLAPTGSTSHEQVAGRDMPGAGIAPFCEFRFQVPKGSIIVDQNEKVSVETFKVTITWDDNLGSGEVVYQTTGHPGHSPTPFIL